MSISALIVLVPCFFLVFLFAWYLASEGQLAGALFFILLLVCMGFVIYFKVFGLPDFSQEQKVSGFPWGLVVALLPVAAIIIVGFASAVSNALGSYEEDDQAYYWPEGDRRRHRRSRRERPEVIIELPQRDRPAVVGKSARGYRVYRVRRHPKDKGISKRDIRYGEKVDLGHVRITKNKNR